MDTISVLIYIGMTLFENLKILFVPQKITHEDFCGI